LRKGTARPQRERLRVDEVVLLLDAEGRTEGI
jgi:hypothetical protein